MIPKYSANQTPAERVALIAKVRTNSSDSLQITDRTGFRYNVNIKSGERDTSFHLHDPSQIGPQIGHVNLWDFGGGVFDILEIEIESGVKMKNQSLLTRWFSPWVGINYRERGLRSAFLDFVIWYAKTKGCRRLVVSRVQPFEGNKVDLKAWYPRHGFRPTGVDGQLEMEIGIDSK